MPFRKIIASAVLSLAAATSQATLLYTSAFTDNGNITTETRTYGDGGTEVWEWCVNLPLLVTP